MPASKHPRAHPKPVRLFLPPLPRADLFDPGCVFPAEELLHRILSLFWRDCCCPPYFTHAPAPVLELDNSDSGALSRPVRAWWLVHDGIVSELEGPGAPSLRPYREEAPPSEQRWPRYEFRLWASPFDVEMMFHRNGLACHGHRTRLFVQPDGRVRVLTRSPWWVG